MHFAESAPTIQKTGDIPNHYPFHNSIGRKIGSFEIPSYTSPIFQVILVGFVCFLGPGMFNALSGLGGGGQINGKAADNANVALYTTFAVTGYFGGAICNYLGPRKTLAFGTTGYCLYTASFLAYNHIQSNVFVIVAGAFLGVAAGCLWSAQGLVLLSYPSEQNKGRYIGYFWAIFNTGAFIGSAIPLGQNFHAKEMKKVNDGSYIIILVLMTLGFVLALFLAPPEKVIRNDGTRVTKVYFPSVRHELMGLVNTMRYEPFIFSLFPFFWASNWFYTYQFNDMNAYYFNIRTRALNNLMYWFMQIFGALTFGSFLDVQSLSRRSRGAAGWVILFVLVNVIWGGGVPFLQTTARKMPSPNMDLYDDGYAAKLWLYMFFGFLDAMWQTFAYWMMGALSNNPQKLAYYSGFYKGIQSAGAAVVWRLDGIGVSFAALYYSSWGLCAGSMLLTALVLAFKITETNITQDDYLTEETNNAQSLTVECPLGTVKEQSPQTKVMEQFDQNTKAF